ncbi:hypothetical protein BS17DRAFT_811380 [Gyrodon lividus]|nr:hypothetical protein BS17DRAFT_811380 [Gyrodon lividus]
MQCSSSDSVEMEVASGNGMCHVPKSHRAQRFAVIMRKCYRIPCLIRAFVSPSWRKPFAFGETVKFDKLNPSAARWLDQDSIRTQIPQLGFCLSRSLGPAIEYRSSPVAHQSLIAWIFICVSNTPFSAILPRFPELVKLRQTKLGNVTIRTEQQVLQVLQSHFMGRTNEGQQEQVREPGL